MWRNANAETTASKEQSFAFMVYGNIWRVGPVSRFSRRIAGAYFVAVAKGLAISAQFKLGKLYHRLIALVREVE